MSQQHLLYSLTLCLFSSLNFSDNAPQYLYDLLLPKLVNFDIEDPAQAEVHFINTCHAHKHGGTQFELPNKELWQAVNSIAMFDIVTQYMPTITASGKIALARQYAQMSNNITTIQQKVELQRYLKQNPGLLRKLNKVIALAQSAEKTFAALFKPISEGEQAEINRINAQLYFSWFSTLLNENEWALEAGPRLNQIHTTAWYTIPPIIASIFHREITHKLAYCDIEREQKVINKIQESGGVKLYQKNLNDKIEQYRGWGYGYLTAEAKEELDIANKYTSTKQEDLPTIAKDLEKKRLDHIADASHIKLLNLLKKEVKQKDQEKLSDEEKMILYANPEGEKPQYQPCFQLISIKGIIPIVRIYAQGGIKNLPSFASWVTKTISTYIYKEATERIIYNSIKKNNPNNSTLKNVVLTGALYTQIAVTASAYPIILLQRYYSTKKLFDLIYEKQQDLFSVTILIKSMQRVYNIINQDPTLRKLLQSEHRQLEALFNLEDKTTSSDLKHLIQQLLSPSFQGDTSYFLSRPGKILATYQLLVRIKHELVPYLETFGNIDAYLTIQKLYLEYENHPRVQFCLPELVDAPIPVLDISEYWHPLIDPNFVVTNSLIMGTNGIKNLMITGPNAGGKTTSLMSLIINIIFAQSFGIAPSKTLTMTPFAKIHSYLDITTNLQEGLSLFAAEVDRAKKLKQSILSCSSDQKTFTIIDEIFSGTNPQVASDVGFKFATQLGEMTHSMAIITTHFPRLTDLEKEVGTFTNYKVADATIMPDGKVVYPFKVIPGISSQNIAQHMLEQQGII